MEKQSEQPRHPYNLFFHPGLTWLDIILSVLASIVLSFKRLTQQAPRATPETIQHLQKLRHVMIRDSAPTKQQLGQWASLYKNKREGIATPIAECTIRAPRLHNILFDWGILHASEESQVPRPPSSFATQEFVDILLWFPVSVLPKKKRDEVMALAGPTNSSHIKINSIDLADIPPEIPIFIFHHLGGMALGSANDSMALSWMIEMTEHAGRFSNDGDASMIYPKAVIASVEYRLAPEHPFPAAPIDTLSAAVHILDSNPLRKIHVGGMSAGGSLACVSGFECFRKYPGRVGSVLSIAPFLSPAADSLSYHLNSKSSIWCSVDFLRWCWKTYLQFDETNKASSNGTASDDDHTASKCSSYCRQSHVTGWDDCPWKANKARRLVDPSFELPPGLDQEDAPKVILCTCQGDPLRDDGLNLGRLLSNAHASLTQEECRGSHAFGFLLDAANRSKVLGAMSSAMFGSSV